MVLCEDVVAYLAVFLSVANSAAAPVGVEVKLIYDCATACVIKHPMNV